MMTRPVDAASRSALDRSTATTIDPADPASRSVAAVTASTRTDSASTSALLVGAESEVFR